MADKNGRLAIADLRSGRNGVDPPQSLAEHECQEALNVDFYNASCGRRRGGVAAVTLTASPFTGKFSAAFRHVPGTVETAAELWAVDDAATPNIGRLTGGTAWATPTLKDVPTGNGWDVTFASLNGLLFIAYQSAVDRLHVWDPVNAIVRRTGVAVMGIPTVANTGVGTYAATARYYRTRATEQQSGVTVRRSEYSTATASFTPSGSGTAATVTQGTVPGEGETHWEVEASTDGITYYRIATVVIATTTYADSAATTTYAASPLSAVTGTYGLQKSYKYIASDQGRVLGFGAYTSTNPQARVEYSAVVGSSDIGDAERVPTGNYQGLNEKDSGVATALAGPINGSFIASKYRELWKLTPTGDVTSPYNALRIHPSIGAIGPHAITIAEDHSGRASLYFESYRGPYRYGIQGIEYIGKGVEDKTIGANGGVSVNLAATNVVSHLLFYPDIRQIWTWIATGSSNDPDTVLVYSLGRTNSAVFGQDPKTDSAWSIFTGGVATARCAVLFSTTIAASMSRTLKPYIGSTSAANTLGKADTGTQDLGVNFQASVTTKVYAPWGDGFSGSIDGAYLTAKVSTGVSIQASVIQDYGLTTTTDTVSLTAAGSETRVQPRFGGAAVGAGMASVHFTIGDAAAVNASWALDGLSVTWTKGAPLVA